LEKVNVIKDFALIRIEHKISLLQQQVWNVLLAFAFDHFDQEYHYKIPIVALQEYIPAASNRKHLEKAVNDLVNIPIGFNVLQTVVNSVRESYSLLSSARFKEGICYYQFPKNLKQRISDPVSCTEINLLIQKQYKGGSYGWFLYELCYSVKEERNTGWFLLAELRQYLGIQTEQYPLFKDFNKRVIKPALQDVNSRTDLNVSAEFKRKGRIVTKVRFIVEYCEDTGEKPSHELLLEKQDNHATQEVVTGTEPLLKNKLFQLVLDDLALNSHSFKRLVPINKARLKREIFSNYISSREELSDMISDSEELADSFYQQQLSVNPGKMDELQAGQEQMVLEEMEEALKNAEHRVAREGARKKKIDEALAEARRRVEQRLELETFEKRMDLKILVEQRLEVERRQKQRNINALVKAGKEAEQRLAPEHKQIKMEMDEIRAARRKGIERLKHLLG